jgi:hypothetical protein
MHRLLRSGLPSTHTGVPCTGSRFILDSGCTGSWGAIYPDRGPISHNMSICRYMYINIYIHNTEMYTNIHVYRIRLRYTYLDLHTYIYTYICTSTRTYTHAYLHKYVYICTYMYMFGPETQREGAARCEAPRGAARAPPRPLMGRRPAPPTHRSPAPPAAS